MAEKPGATLHHIISIEQYEKNYKKNFSKNEILEQKLKNMEKVGQIAKKNLCYRYKAVKQKIVVSYHGAVFGENL